MSQVDEGLCKLFVNLNRAHLVEEIRAGLAERVVRLPPAGDDADLALERVVHRGQADGNDVVPV